MGHATTATERNARNGRGAGATGAPASAGTAEAFRARLFAEHGMTEAPVAEALSAEEVRALPAPLLLNVGVAALAGGTAVACLITASTSASWLVIAACALLFSFVNNTLFSLLHEAVHTSASRHRGLNERLGLLVAVFFPTSFTFQRHMHLGHHRRNRTDTEMFDMHYPNDSMALKRIQLYGVLTGVYWAMAPLGCLIFLCCPWLLRLKIHRQSRSVAYYRTSTNSYLASLDQAPGARIRLEILFAIVCQAALFLWCGVTWQGWLACYAAFGVNWAALQYADHAYSVRDIAEGAWNLKVQAPIRWLFLNYHYHLAHHRHPQVSWLHLPKLVGKTPQVSFWRIYRELWKGTKLTLEPPPVEPAADFASRGALPT